jgi:hypothetical protein
MEIMKNNLVEMVGIEALINQIQAIMDSIIRQNQTEERISWCTLPFGYAILMEVF